jgi:selenide,water dikinase
MKSSPVPILKDLVLLGGGHTHVAVLRRFGMRPIPGVRLTVVARDVHTPYSGMLPGLVAGHYEFDEVHIDLGPLCRFAGARLVHAAATGLDLERREVCCADRPPIRFDLLSINIGATPSLDGVPGAAGGVVPVKPISTFVERWDRLRERVAARSGAVRVGVVGAGAGGVELALAVNHALGDQLEALGRSRSSAEVHLFGAGAAILPTHNRGMRNRLQDQLDRHGLRVHLGQAVTDVAPGQVTRADGSTMALDEILWVTQAGAAPWLGRSGLAVDDAGFVEVDATLQSVSHPGVFAVGDVAAVVDHPREKAGVFAVRQGPPLTANLRRALLSQPLKPFRPQRRFLTLISTGDRYAVGSRGWLAFEGRWAWRWKDWIDRRFMSRYRDLPEMRSNQGPDVEPGLASPELLAEISTAEMRCGGCGSKVGATPLERVLERLEPIQRDDVIVGLDAPDDAAIIRVPPGKVQVRTVDAFRSIVDDPYVFGQITANHCLGDIFAMGADAQSALAVAAVPFGLDHKVEDTLVDLLAGAVAMLNEAGATLVGGHTSEGVELSLGLSLTGLVDEGRALRKAGLQPGHRLILTKPLGTGTLFAAHMRLKAKGRWIDGAINSMLQSSRDAADLLVAHGAVACTDVTGFGLLGHLVEMARASGVNVELRLDAVPALAGALETSAAGWLSSLHPHNVRLRRAVEDVDRVGAHPAYRLLFDPQTAGGLLAGVPEDRTEPCLAALRAAGYDAAAEIGVVRTRADGAPVCVADAGQ